jgi:DHA2 family multidrug resistance protein-like MFS transporter
VSIIAGVTIAVVFVRRQQTLADPLIDLRLFRSPVFSVSLGVNMLGCFMIFGSFLFTAQYFQLVVGLTPIEAGLWMLPSALTVTLGSLLAPAIVRHFRPASVIAVGLLCVAAGFAVLTQVSSHSLAVLLVGSVIFSLGLGPVFILTTALVLGSAPAERAGAASATSETGSELGGALGIAILGSIGTAIYRVAIAQRVTLAVPAVAARAARETLGSAVAAAQHLPGDLGTSVSGAAREAFVQAFHAMAAVNVGIAVGLAIVAAVVLRKSRPQSDAAREPELATAS